MGNATELGTRTEVRERLIEVLQEHGGKHAFSFRERLDNLDLERDLAVDSLHMLDIILHIEDTFDVSIPDDIDRKCLRSVAKMTDYIVGQLSAASSGSAASNERRNHVGQT